MQIHLNFVVVKAALWPTSSIGAKELSILLFVPVSGHFFFRSASIGETLRQCLKDVAETEKYLDQHWDDVEAHALRAQTGQTFKLRVSILLF